MPNPKCKKCIWSDQCDYKDACSCDDYTPYDDELELDAYEEDINMRENIYKEQIIEQNS